MNRLLPLVLLLVLPIAACDSSQSDEGAVRFVHAAPGAPDVSFFLGDVQEENIAFGETLPYQLVPTGDLEARVRSAENAERRYLDQFVRVEEDQRATLILLDTSVVTPYLYLQDVPPAAPSGRSLRVVHAAPTLGPIDLFEADPFGGPQSAQPVATLSFRENTGFVRTTSTPARLVAVSRADPSRRAVISVTSFNASGRATVVLSERTRGGELVGFALDEAPPPNPL
jgi:hypothetical protein